MKKSLLLLSLVITCVSLNAQPGKDGVKVVSSQSVIVNHYVPVAGNVLQGTSTLTLARNASVCYGDLILVYQAQGATINTQNSSSYGQIINYGSAGLYELQYVKSVTGKTITIQGNWNNSYQSAGNTQLVRIPQFSTLTVNPGASICAMDWKDTLIGTQNYRIGGILAVHASNITNNGTLTASGAGFRGGEQDVQATFVMGITDFASISNTDGGPKGESIAGFKTEYNQNGGAYCMGAPANAGGGGNAHNAAGGGGANGNNGNVWTGEGVMVVDANNPLGAWSLSAAYINNSNSLTNSSGGGKGGYSWGNTNLNATVTAPGDPSWQGDSRREVGGVGGRPLSNINGNSRVYFGGGGGAAEANDLVTPGGGNGGGIVFLICNGIAGGGLIAADGIKAGDTFASHNDGGSGGGGGGTVVLKINSISPSQTVSALGGDGGKQFVPGPPANLNESDGPGGGGGGGVIASSQPVINFDISGGINGTTQSPSVTEFIYNGATSGAKGQTLTASSQILTFIEGGQNPGDPCFNVPTLVNGLSQEQNIRVYPNPFTEYLHIEGVKPGANEIVQLCDVVGRVVYRQQLTKILEVPGLKPGIYFLSVSSFSGTTMIGKFIKE